MANEKIDKLKTIIEKSNNIVFFGGAGVSTESGIPDFRSANGIFMLNYNYQPEQIVSHSFFTAHTKEFFEFYRKYFYYPDAKPNITHLALAKLEKQGKLSAVITQNIDGLHTMAGCKTVYEVHGCVLKNTCMKCNKKFGIDTIIKSDCIPRCNCGGIIKPDVVLYEEGLDDETVNNAINAISKADTLIVGGTSLRVYPAAGFIRYFKGENLVLINRDETELDKSFSLVINDSLGNVFKELL